MSNTASAKKEHRKAIRRRKVNVSVASRVKTHIKKLSTMIAAQDKQGSIALLPQVQAEIMKAVTKKVLKLQTASRKVSLLAQKVKKLCISQ